MNYNTIHTMFNNDVFDALLLSKKHKAYNYNLALKLKFKARFREAYNASSIYT
jgi:hypothetical protein